MELFIGNHLDSTRLIVTPLDDCVVIAIGGDLDVYTVQDLREPLLAAMVLYSEPIILDLTGVKFVDTAGLALLMQAYAYSHSQPTLRLTPGGQVERLAHLAHLDGLFRSEPRVPTPAK